MAAYEFQVRGHYLNNLANKYVTHQIKQTATSKRLTTCNYPVKIELWRFYIKVNYVAYKARDDFPLGNLVSIYVYWSAVNCQINYCLQHIRARQFAALLTNATCNCPVKIAFRCFAEFAANVNSMHCSIVREDEEAALLGCCLGGALPVWVVSKAVPISWNIKPIPICM